ncbi:MAG: VWA domain-containing protein, partial [Deltaproteobacteria bacterium]|nr:VWA domain-containing protein [Deltaproteobacteria bacterium]
KYKFLSFIKLIKIWHLVLVLGWSYFLAIPLLQEFFWPIPDEERAIKLMNRLLKTIEVETLPLTRGKVDLEPSNLAEILPDIDLYPPLTPARSRRAAVEIFSSPEKATVAERGPDSDRWLVDMALAFNATRPEADGRPYDIVVRGLSSGLALDYIISNKRVPDGYSPSNAIWGEALKAQGVPLELVAPRLAGNVAGLVINQDKFPQFQKTYGAVTALSIAKATNAGDFNLGYTNPLSSSTGINFLLRLLESFNPEDPLSEEAVAPFQSFQQSVPVVAYTTLQMKEAAKSGFLDGFVFESQQFQNSPDLKNDYVFVPFGVRHDNPLYFTGREGWRLKALRAFAEFCLRPENQQLASQYGFNELDDYQPKKAALTGESLTLAQKLYKDKKSGAREIVAVFVCDVSGSMAGQRLRLLKKSLSESFKVISSNNYLGLVLFSKRTQLAAPIGQFNLNQRAIIAGAIENTRGQGGTAMYDAILYAEKMIQDFKVDRPNANFAIFVLTDGESNSGLAYSDVYPVISGLKVPIHVIGYATEMDSLRELAAINEAAAISANTEDVVYQLRSLFNAEL